MRRREFIMGLGGAAATWPLPAFPQQIGKVPTIGFLTSGTQLSHGAWLNALVQRLRELGWVEGKVALEYRWGEGRNERYAEIAAEFVRLKVDVIVTGGNALPAATKATSTIPIVFALAADPFASGAVLSLAKPGRNVTGLSMQQHDLTGKRIELLREIVPDLRRLAVIANAATPASALESTDVQTTARKLGLEIIVSEVRQAADIVPAMEAIKGRADALYVVGDAFTSVHRTRIITMAHTARLPTMHNFREQIEAGGLVAYGPNITDLFRRAAGYVDKILRGTKPGDLPVEQPTKFDLIINLTTAKALNLAIPPTVLARADEVIE